MKTRRRTKGSCGFRKKLGEGESTGTVKGESAMSTRSRSLARETVLGHGGALKSKIAQPSNRCRESQQSSARDANAVFGEMATVEWRPQRLPRSGGFSFPARIRRRARFGAS